MRVYAWLLIRANRDTHTHMCTHIRVRDVVTWMQKGTGTNHIHKRVKNKRIGKTKNKSTFVSLLYISETIQITDLQRYNLQKHKKNKA